MSRYDEMIRYLPQFYQGSLDVDEMMQAEGLEFDKLNDDIKDILDQFYIEKATWGLAIWEKEFGITHTPAQTLLHNAFPERYYEERRARIKSKITGNGTFSVQDALNLANQFSDPKTAEFIKIPGNYQFKTRHNVDDIIDYSKMIEAFEEMKPAHLKHIKGLLIDADMYSLKESMKLKLKAHIKWNVYFFSNSVKIKMTVGFAGTSDIIHDSRSPYLVLNGAWNLDGSQALDGVNEKTQSLYYEQADVLTIRKKQNGSLVSTDVA